MNGEREKRGTRFIHESAITVCLSFAVHTNVSLSFVI